MKPWSRTLVLAVLVCCAGCSEGAKLVQETDRGGVVTYPFKGENGYLFTKLRQEAIAMIEDRCKGHYSIIKEGEAKGRTRLAETATGGPDEIVERRWGLQFRCKVSDK